MRKLLIASMIFSLFASLASCGQKTHFRFEKIKDAYFRESTNFFSMHNLLWVVERDKLVCVDPVNGEMLEYSDLPGYVQDAKPVGSGLGMIFKAGSGYIFKRFSFSPDKPHIIANKTFVVEGSKFLSIRDDSMILYDDKSGWLTRYSGDKRTGKHVFEKKVYVGLTNDYEYPKGVDPIVLAYDGENLTFAGFDSDGQVVYPMEGMARIGLPARDFAKSFVVENDSYSLCIYDGESFCFVVSEDDFKTYIINKTRFPNLTSVESDSFNVYASNGNSLFIIDYEVPTRISDDRFVFLDSDRRPTGRDGELSEMMYLLGMKLGKAYKLGLMKTVGSINLIRGSNTRPDVLTFDYLPEGAIRSKIALIDGKHYVYAFTSEGLYKSEPLE